MNNKFRLFILTLITNIIWSNAINLIEEKFKTICMPELEDSCSSLGNGYECINNICKCIDDEICEKHLKTQKFSSKANIVGEQCNKNSDCNIDNTICNHGSCYCLGDRVPSNDKRKCLEISGGLGLSCEEDVQCLSKIDNSVCKNKKCICNDIHHRDKLHCFPNVDLGGNCNFDGDCSHILHSECGPMKFCNCEKGYITSSTKKQCLLIATQPNDFCVESVQCQELYGNAANCRNNRCECNGEHLLFNNLACPSKLKEHCEFDSECKMFRDDSSMHCENGRCECASPYQEKLGVCNGKYMIASNISALILMLVLLAFNAIMH